MGLPESDFEELLAAMSKMSRLQRLKVERALRLAEASAMEAEEASLGRAPDGEKLYPGQGEGVLPPPKPRGRLAASLATLPELTDEEVDRMEAAIAASKASWQR